VARPSRAWVFCVVDEDLPDKKTNSSGERIMSSAFVPVSVFLNGQKGGDLGGLEAEIEELGFECCMQEKTQTLKIKQNNQVFSVYVDAQTHLERFEPFVKKGGRLRGLAEKL
jgi:hypothetical protein